MRLLTADCGFNLGYAFFASGQAPQSGAHRIEGSYEDLGRAMLHFDQVFSRLIARFKPDVIGYAEIFVGMIPIWDRSDPKQPHLVKWQPVAPENIGPLFAFVGKLNELATSRRLDCVKVDEARARNAFLDVVPRKRKLIKSAVMAGARQRGWSPCSEDAADALCVGTYIMSRMDKPERAHEHTPLFAGEKQCLGRTKTKRKSKPFGKAVAVLAR